MALEHLTDEQIEAWQARCRRALQACDDAELADCAAWAEEHFGLSVPVLIGELARVAS